MTHLYNQRENEIKTYLNWLVVVEGIGLCRLIGIDLNGKAVVEPLKQGQ